MAIIALLWSCTTSPKVYVGVSQCSTDDWREKMNQELALESTQHPGIKLEIVSAENDNGKQIADIRRFIDKGVDVLIVSPREAESISPAIAEARRRGIKVLVFDRETSGDDYDSFYGADNVLIGKNAYIYTSKYLTPAHTPEQPMGVLELRGLDGSSPARGRAEGYRQGMAGSGGRIKLLGSASTDWTPESARRAADSLLRKYPTTELIYAHNDRMALAARGVADSLGMHGIRIIGVDGAPGIGLEGVKSGKIDATFIYPTDGAEILQRGLALHAGEEVPKRETVKSAMAIDSSNVDLQLLSAHTLDHSAKQIRNLSKLVTSYQSAKQTMQALLWVGFALLVSVSFSLFILLRFYWSRKRSQELAERQNEELREQRDSLKELNIRVNEATASKISFFTNVSHDLRTPLTLISAPLEAVAESGGLDGSRQGLLQIAMKNVRILRRLINQVLDFQKYDQGMLELQLSKTDITAAVVEWAEAFKGAARRKNIKLKVSAEPSGVCEVMIDKEKMERIFFNIMSNAFKYTPANGHIEVRLNTEGDNIELRVIDDGKGIPAESIPHLFEEFYQVRGGNSGGSGIGLAVVRSFVELHGGSVRAESSAEGGATFTVVIPKKEVPESDSESPASGPDRKSASTGMVSDSDIAAEVCEVEIPDWDDEEKAEGYDRAIVLAVDDNPDMRALMKALLQKEFRVLTAPDGEAGIRIASKYVPDCIIADVMMPGIDGLEMAKRLKRETVTSHIPIIMLTACGMEEQHVAGYDSGADGYMAKPFSEKVLVSCIRSLIANRKLLKGRLGPEPGDSDIAESAVSGGHRKMPLKSAADPLSEIDSAFYRKFVEMAEKEIGNPDLTVEDLAGHAGMSRVQFYRKLKAITNYSPADLLKLMRLRRAKEMLITDSEVTVSEVGYKVGFSSPSYFAKCYKAQFGELPSETQRRTSRLS